MDAVWVNKIEIGTALNNSTWTYKTLCEGILGMNFANNEQNQQNYFLCGNGFAHNQVTGAAPEIVISGKREVGNEAQDFIASLQFAIGSDRESSVKVTTGGKIITCDCTICDIVSFGGDAIQQNAFACTIRFNGEPTVTDAA